ncbi:MAG: hypothetical protein KDK61_08350, partial [Simkania sp.]|nr:hypothetical protein [Simkania sp.]
PLGIVPRKTLTLKIFSFRSKFAMRGVCKVEMNGDESVPSVDAMILLLMSPSSLTFNFQEFTLKLQLLN